MRARNVRDSGGRLPRSSLFVGASLLALAGCAASGPTTPNAEEGQSSGGSAEAPRRARPSRRAVARALADAAERAGGCLPGGVNSLDVQGSFVGSTGAFSTSSVVSDGQAVTGPVAACVRGQFDGARVDPFREERFDSSYTVVRATPRPGGALAALAAPPAGATAVPVAAAPAPEASAAPAPAPSAPMIVPGPLATARPVAPPGNQPAVGTPVRAATPPAPAVAAAAVALPLDARALAGCRTATLRLDPALAGEARLRFVVLPDGVVRDLRTEVQGTVRGRPPVFTQFLRCSEQRLRANPQLRRFAGVHDITVQMGPPNEVADGLAVRPYQEPAAVAANGASAATAAGGDGQTTMLDPAQIANVVRGRADALRECFRTQLAHSPQLRVRMRARVIVETAGVVSHASSAAVLEAGDPDAALEVGRCTEGVLRATSFPARAGGGPVELVLPLAFAPEHPTNATPAYAGAPPAYVPPAAYPGAQGGFAPPYGGPPPAGPEAAIPTPGRVDPGAVSQTIRSQMPLLQACYTRQLAGSPGLAGRVLVRFVVDPAGRVIQSRSTIEPRGGDPVHFGEVARCLDGLFPNIPMPPPMGGAAAVTLPLDFGS